MCLFPSIKDQQEIVQPLEALDDKTAANTALGRTTAARS